MLKGHWPDNLALSIRKCEPGPLYSINLITIACYFMLGEIEASLLLYHKVFIDHDRKEVTIKLP